MKQVKSIYPNIFNGLLAKYHQSTTGFFRGLESGIDLLDQEEGLGPGAVETSWLYDLTVQPLVAEVHNIVSKEGGIISTIVSKDETIEKSSTMVHIMPPSFDTIFCTSATRGLTVKSYSQDVSTAPGPRPSSWSNRSIPDSNPLKKPVVD